MSANRRALELEPENQKLVNDLGWTLLQAGRLPQAREALERAVSMDPSGELAKENLRYCRQRVARTKLDEGGNSQPARRAPRTPKNGRHRYPSQRIRLAGGRGIETPMCAAVVATSRPQNG